MPDNDQLLLRRLLGGEPQRAVDLVVRAAASDHPPLLVAAAVLTRDPRCLLRAGQHAVSTRDRQLVALADAHLRGDADLFDALVRDHLVDHPDSQVAAWIAGRHLTAPPKPTADPSC